MNSKLVTGHGTTGYRFTQATTVLGHAPWTKEKEDESVGKGALSSVKELNTSPLNPKSKFSRRQGFMDIHAPMDSMRTTVGFTHKCCQ